MLRIEPCCGVRIVGVPRNQMNGFVREIRKRRRVARVLHQVLVKQNREFSFRLNLPTFQEWQERLFENGPVSGFLLRFLESRHRLLAGRARVGFDHNDLPQPIFIGHMNQVTATPPKIFRRSRKQRLDRCFISFRMQVAVSAHDPIAAEFQQMPNQRMNLRVKHTRVEV